jgi:hypothetical protein
MIYISEDGADYFLLPQRLDKRLSQWREFQQPKTATLTHNTIGAVCVGGGGSDFPSFVAHDDVI